ncbi:MAG: helix-turn-helix domain-containing protein [Pseudomonadota bacterium]
MSHVATAWAFDIRHLKPATKIVLLILADCHNPEHGCFPSQEFLADACEMSVRSVRDHLSKLEELGLISRSHRSRVGTKFTSDGYELHFDRVLTEPKKPAAKFAGRQDLPAAGNDNSQRQNLPPNPVRELGKESVCAAEADHTHTKFEEFWSVYPRPRDRDATHAAFLAAIERGWEPATIIAGAVAYASENRGNGRQYLALSANWLKRDGWKDYSNSVDHSADGKRSDRFIASLRSGCEASISTLRNAPELAQRFLADGVVTAAELKEWGVQHAS